MLGLVAAVVLAGTGFQARASPDPPRAATTPVFMSLDPDGGEYLRGGSPYYIQWNVTHDGDSDLYSMIDYSTDSGATYPYRIAAGNFSTYGAYFNWSVPYIDATTVRVQVCVYPLDGHTACRASLADFTIDSTPPYLVMTSPADGQMDVPLTAPLVIVFSEPMLTPSVYWMIVPPVSLIPSWSTDNATLTLTPTVPWLPCVMYTITVGGQDRAGWPLSSGPVPNPWSFTTLCGNPYIVATSPSNGAVGVALDALIVVTFSEPMNTMSVSWNITPATTLTPTWTNGDTTLTLSHAQPFASCTVYTVYVSGEDVGGNPLITGPVPNPWSFTTACPGTYIVSTDPMHNETNVNVDRPIVVTFSAPMDRQTTIATINPSISLSATWTQNDTVVTYAHNLSFASCTPYTVQVSGNDTTGVPLVPGPVPNPWSFTTASCGPVILSTSPPDGATNVAVDAPIVVTFSEPMNTTSLVVTFLLPPFPTINFTLSWSGGDTIVTLSHTAPFADATVYRLQVAADSKQGPPLTAGPAPNPWYFTTCACAPHITNVTPAPGASHVPLNAPIVVTFNEPMDPASLSFDILPPVANLVPSWSVGDTVLTVTHAPFGPCVVYTVTVGVSDVGGLPIVPGPVPNPWSFTTVCLPSVVLVSPAGGEDWTGGSVHTVSWSLADADDPTLTVAFNLSISGGASWTPIRSPGPYPGGTSSFPWVVPSVDATNAIVRVDVSDSDGNTATDASGLFMIDSTPPQVLSATPVGPHAPLSPTATVTFSEAMSVFSGGPPTVTPPAPYTPSWGPGSTVLTLAFAGLSPCTRYTVSLSQATNPWRDASDPGNPLAPYAWSFTTQCMPSAALLVPVGGEDWTGGTAHMVSWTLADADDPMLTVSLLLSFDGGATFATFGTPMPYLTGAGAASWSLPLADTTRAVLRLVATDSDGNTATDDSPPFTIDSTPPAILASFPLDGESGFKTTRAIWFVFTERVDRASFVASFSISPNPGGIVQTWSNISGADVLTVDHAPFKSKTDYTVTFGTAAKDDSDPGNHPAAPLVVRFSTQPPPNVNPPVAKAVGHNQVEVGQPATFDGRSSTGNITSYVWRIVDNQGRLVNVLVGAVVTHTFQQNGRYSVTLIVRDANGLTDDDTLEIAVTSNPHSEGYLLAGGALLVAAVVAATESGKYGLFGWILFPLYVRRKRNEALEHQTRGMILGYVMVHPGDTYTDIKRNLVLSNGTLSYHLRVMEREGLIRSQTKGPHKHFFPLGVRVPEDGGGLHEIQMRMLGAVREVPGLAVKDIAGALGITSQHALYHLRALAAKGLVRLEKRGFNLRCYAEPPRTP